MAKNTDNIELRSEKVRNIIGQIPPKIIRIGISLIFVIIIGILIGTYFFEYNYTIETTATIEQKNDTTFIQLKIPANEKNKIKKGHRVILSFNNIQNIYNKRFETELQKIPNTLKISKKEGYYTAEIEVVGIIKTTDNETLEIKEKENIKAEIITDKISFLDRIIRPFKSIMNARK